MGVVVSDPAAISAGRPSAAALAGFTGLTHRAISTFLIKQAGLKRAQAATGAVTLIQRFGSAANFNIHLHCLVLDGVYHTTEDTTVFHPVRAPSAEQLHTLLHQIIKRVMTLLTPVPTHEIISRH